MNHSEQSTTGELQTIDFSECMTETESAALHSIAFDFLREYARHYKESIHAWMPEVMQRHLPDHSPEVLGGYVQEIGNTLKITEEKRNSLADAVKKGISREGWFAEDLKKSTAFMAAKQAEEYYCALDEAVKNANDAMMKTCYNQDGTISGKLNLDGFIAEQHHAQSFNLNAAAKESTSRASVLEPAPGNTYGKNSVDLVVKDQNGAGAVQFRAQLKYGKTAEDTIRLIKRGDYRGQRLIVPADQVQEVQKAFPNRKVSSMVESGGVQGAPLTKAEAKALQREAQNGNLGKTFSWNDFSAKDLARGIAKNAGEAALLSAAISAGITIMNKIKNKEEIETSEVVKEGLKSGADTGIKAALAGAIKVGVEKGLIRIIPKGTPISTIANIVYISVENIKIAVKVAMGKLTVLQGLDKAAETTICAVAGIAAAAKGGSIGASIGAVLGPVGAFVGGIAGGVVGYAAGSKVAEVAYNGAKKLVFHAAKTVKSAVAAVKNYNSGIAGKEKVAFGV